MISEYIRYSLPADKLPEIEPAYQKASKWLDQSPHCLGYELSVCTDDSSKWILHIHWDSHDGHLKEFRSSREFRSFYQEVAPFVKFIDEMRHYDLTAVQRITAS